MVSGVSRKRPTASNRRHARQTEPEALEVNVHVEEDDHVDVANDYVDNDVGVEDDDVDNDIGVEAYLMEDDVSVDDDNTEPVQCNDAAFSVSVAVHRLGRDEYVLYPDMLYETIGRMLQVLDGQSLGSTLTHTEHQAYYRKRRRMDRT